MCSDPFTDRKLLHKVHWTLDIDVRKVFSFLVYSHPDDFIIEDVRKSESYVENKKMQKKKLFFFTKWSLVPAPPPLLWRQWTYHDWCHWHRVTEEYGRWVVKRQQSVWIEISRLASGQEWGQGQGGATRSGEMGPSLAIGKSCSVDHSDVTADFMLYMVKRFHFSCLPCQ